MGPAPILVAITISSSLLLATSPTGHTRAAEPGADRAPAAETRNNDAKPPELPAALVALKPKLLGKTPAEVLAIVIKELGQPTRTIGSGLQIPQWDIAGGVLTVHPRQGPTYTEHGSRIWIIDTQNRAGENIIAGYEMATVADPKNHGTRFWMGNLDLHPDGHYVFRPSNSNLGEKAKNPSNFFFEHPSGTYVVEYPPGLTEASILEKLDDKALLATLHFTANGAKDAPAARASMTLHVDVKRRRIHFGSAGDVPLTFEMDKTWERFWK